VTHPQPSRLPAEDRRRQLIETALDFFARKGFDGTTTKEIAAAAGVTEAIIFRHFPTKQALYTAVLGYHHESGKTEATLDGWKLLMDANDDIGLLRAMVNHMIQSYRSDSRMHRALLFAALEGHQSGLDQHRQKALPVFELLCTYIARRQAEGAIRNNVPAGAIVGALIGAANHYAMMTEFFGFCADATDEQVGGAFLDILLHGILPEASIEKATA
jgi:TetR/AcrR family transcriptional regulator